MVVDSARDATRQRPLGLDAPQASRVGRPRWRHPQLIVGVLLVLVSTVVGVRVVAGADDTVAVLVAARDLSPGQPLDPDMVVTRQVALEGGYGPYYTGSVGEGYVVQRPVRRGELLPKSAVAAAGDVTAGADALRLLTLAVPGAEIPAGLVAGDAVDVWVTPAENGAAERAVAGLTVTEVEAGGALGMGGNKATVTLAVRAGDGRDLDALVGRLIAAGRDERVYLSKLP